MTTSGDQPAAAPIRTGRQRLASALTPRVNRRQLGVGLLCAVLGFAAVTQVQSRRGDTVLSTARQSDLVQILDGQTQLAQQLSDELADLRATMTQFASDDDKERTALEQAQQRRAVLGVLAGTLPATGPGITVFVPEGHAPVEASVLLGAVQELRNAGAEAIQINDARIVASSYFTDGDTEVAIDGASVLAPYLISAIGDASKLATAMGIPGGVVDALARDGFTATVTERISLSIDALRPLETDSYASPSVDGGQS